MFALPCPVDLDQARRVLTEPAASRSAQRLAWAALKSARGQPVLQHRLNALAEGHDPAARSAPITLAIPDHIRRAMEHRRAMMRERMVARTAMIQSATPTGGDAA
jgi:hypothetical protein